MAGHREIGSDGLRKLQWLLPPLEDDDRAIGSGRHLQRGARSELCADDSRLPHAHVSVCRQPGALRKRSTEIDHLSQRVGSQPEGRGGIRLQRKRQADRSLGPADISQSEREIYVRADRIGKRSDENDATRRAAVGIRLLRIGKRKLRRRGAEEHQTGQPRREPVRRSDHDLLRRAGQRQRRSL